MFNSLFNLLEKDQALQSFSSISQYLCNILDHFDEKDHTIKNAAIDCLIQILQEFKKE